MKKTLVCHAGLEPYFTVSNLYSVVREETNEDDIPFFFVIDNEGDEFSLAAVTGYGEYSYDWYFYLLEE